MSLKHLSQLAGVAQWAPRDRRAGRWSLPARPANGGRTPPITDHCGRLPALGTAGATLPSCASPSPGAATGRPSQPAGCLACRAVPPPPARGVHSLVEPRAAEMHRQPRRARALSTAGLAARALRGGAEPGSSGSPVRRAPPLTAHARVAPALTTQRHSPHSCPPFKNLAVLCAPRAAGQQTTPGGSSGAGRGAALSWRAHRPRYMYARACVCCLSLSARARPLVVVVFQRVRLAGLGRVVERVRVLRGLALQLARVGQAASAAVAEEPAAGEGGQTHRPAPGATSGHKRSADCGQHRNNRRICRRGVFPGTVGCSAKNDSGLPYDLRAKKPVALKPERTACKRLLTIRRSLELLFTGEK